MKRGQHGDSFCWAMRISSAIVQGIAYAYITTGRPRASDRSRFSHGDKELSS